MASALHQLGQLIAAHRLLVYAFACNAIFSLPTPKPDERWYGYVFTLLHAIPNLPRTIQVLRVNAAALNGNGNTNGH